MWSVGCIMGELLRSLQQRDARPLFPGSASAMSEDALEEKSLGGNEALDSYLDREAGDGSKEYQLRKIFDVIGTPTDLEVQQLAACAGGLKSKIERALKTMRHCDRADFTVLFEQTNVLQPGLVQLIGRLLLLNPIERISAEEALQLPLFEQAAAEWATQEKTELHTFSRSDIRTDFEAVEEPSQLKQLLLGEVRRYDANRMFSLDFASSLGQ
jgi:hypothetical protein